MTQLKIYCITNIQSEKLEKLGLNLVGVGKNSFNSKYITCEGGDNINSKEKNYSELTSHYWFWKNKMIMKIYLNINFGTILQIYIHCSINI